MGKYRSTHTGPQIDAGIDAALNPDTVPEADSDALITSDAVAKVQQGFAPIETGATAANAYAIGDLLVWGGVLCKAKTAIAVSDAFVIDTNIEATTIADKLNNIDTEITSDTDTTLTGLLTGNGSKVEAKSLDTSGLTNDADHVPTSGVVKSAIVNVENDLSTIHQTSPTCTETNGIAAGVFFYLDNELVVAKTAIANGAAFTLNTNYEPPTAGSLNALKSALDSIGVDYELLADCTSFSIDIDISHVNGRNLNDYRFVVLKGDNFAVSQCIPTVFFKMSGVAIMWQNASGDYFRAFARYNSDTKSHFYVYKNGYAAVTGASLYGVK